MKPIIRKTLSGLVLIGIWPLLIYGYIKLQSPPSDETIRERIVGGQWTEHDGGPAGDVDETRTYKADGTLEGSGTTGKTGTPAIHYSFSGTWKVENGALKERLDKGDLLLVRRRDSDDQVLRISSTSMYLAIPGSDFRYYRHRAGN